MNYVNCDNYYTLQLFFVYLVFENYYQYINVKLTLTDYT